jgi:hypothetical protein
MLVSAANISAIGMFTPLLDKFPLLRPIDIKHWDFILTIAAVFMASSRLNNLHLGDAREEALMEVIAERLDQWQPDGTHAFEDCKKLYESEYDRLAATGHEKRFLASDSVGKWIVLNVFGRAPQSDDECMLVRAAGAMVTHAFFNWWDAK